MKRIHSHRFKGEKNKYHLTIRQWDHFVAYREECKRRGVPHVQFNTWSRVMIEAHNAMLEELVENRQVYLPDRMARIIVNEYKNTIRMSSYPSGKRRIVGLPPVDWKKTTELWENNPGTQEAGKVIRHDPSSGYMIEIYFRDRYRFMRKLKFIAAITLLRRVSAAIKEKSSLR